MSYFYLLLIWYISAIYLKKHNKIKLNNIRILSNVKREVVVATHADDESIGMYKYIKDHYKNIELIYMQSYGSNTNKENKKIRDKELDLMIKHLRIKLYTYSEINDNYFNSIDRIFIPSPFDWHNEHIETIEKILKLINDKVEIICYQETTPIPDKIIEYIYPINRNEVNNKYTIIKKIYKSQFKLPWERFKYIDISHGNKNEYASEVFFSSTKANIEQMLSFRDNNVNSFINLKNMLNNLIHIRNEVNKLYYEFSKYNN